MKKSARSPTNACIRTRAGLSNFRSIFVLIENCPCICEKCSGDHTQHLCEIAGNERFDLIKELAKKPDCMCMNCGRMADNRASLCNPMPMEDIPASH